MLSANDRTESFVELITRYQPRIFLFILSLVHNRADAEDVLSDVTLVLWRKFEEFRPGSDFRAWAFAVAAQRAKCFLESRRNRLCPSDAFVEQLVAAAGELPDRHHELLDALEQCKRKLRLPDQDLLQRRYAPRATIASVAAEVSRSEAALYKALARIRQALYACIHRTLAQGEHP